MTKKPSDYCRLIAELPCAVCGLEGTTQAHHLLRTGHHGLSLKSGDRFVVPLCVKHHEALHHSGDEVAFFADKVDALWLSGALWAAHGSSDTDWMRDLVVEARRGR
jgi:hypothetical protein